MGILRPVVQAFMSSMLDPRHDLLLCGPVARQLVCDHNTGRAHLLLQKLAKQTLGGLLVAPALDQNVEHDPILVHGPPEPVLLSADHQAPLASRAGESHPHALPEPYVTLSRHTAPGVRPFPCGMETALPWPQSSSRYRLALGRGGTLQPLWSSSITEPSSLLRAAPPLCPASVL